MQQTAHIRSVYQYDGYPTQSITLHCLANQSERLEEKDGRKELHFPLNPLFLALSLLSTLQYLSESFSMKDELYIAYKF